MRLLFSLIFLDLLGFGIIIPLLPFMALRLGAGPQDVTFLIATYSGALLLAAPLWGRLSDRIGRKPVLVIAFAGTTAAFAIMAFADQLWMLFLARGLAGALSGDIAAAPAYVSDITTPERRAKAMGILGAAFGLAFTIGPGLGAYLAGPEPSAETYRLVPLISAALSALTLLLALVLLPESRKPLDARPVDAPAQAAATGFRGLLRVPHLGLVIFIIFVISVVFSSMESTLPLWSEAELGWGPRQVGYLFVFAGVIAVICQGGLIGPLTRLFGEPSLILACVVLLGLGMASVGLAHGLPLLLVGVACLAAGFGLGNPALQSLVSRLSPANSTGGALGISQSTSSLARVLGPPSAGYLFESFGHAAPYFVGAGVMAGAILFAQLLRRRLAVAGLGRATSS